MDYIIASIKTMIAGLCSAIIVYFDPVIGKLQSLLGLFLLNFIVGFVCGKLVNNEKFDLKKFRECFIWAAAILVIICALYFIGERNGDPEGTIECLHVAVLVAIWAFGTNILKNFCRLARGNEPVYRFFYACYYWISFDFIKRLPFLSSIVERNGKKDAEDLNDIFELPTTNNSETQYESTADQDSKYL